MSLIRNIFGSKQKKDDGPPGPLQREANPQGPYTSLFKNYVARKVSPSLYEALRESIPVIDTAIGKLTTLDGLVVVDGDNKGLVQEIEDWKGSVRVNDMERGFQSFVNNQGGETYEQGFCIAEAVPNRDKTDIVRLNVADSKDIRFRKGKGGMEVWYRGRSDYKGRSRDSTEQVGDILRDNISAADISSLIEQGWVQLDNDKVIYSSIANENSNPYGTSIIRSMPFVAKTLLTIENATLNSWERFGDPMYKVLYKAGKKKLGEDIVKDRAEALKKAFKSLIQGKREGKSGDLVWGVDSDSDIVIQVIGADNQVLEMEIPTRHALEQICAKTGLFPWVFGFVWGTNERLAQQQSTLMLQEAETRCSPRLPVYTKIIEDMLRLRGRKWKRDDWFLAYDRPNLFDIEARARANFLDAQAEMVRGDSATRREDPPEKGAAPTRSKGSKCCGETQAKEARPIPHPELDAVENTLLDKLTEGWKQTEEKVLTILKLPSESKSVKGPEDLPLAEEFKFTDEQVAAVKKAMKDFAGEWNPAYDESRALSFYYGESYSLGAIQAAHMTGASRPIIDIITNSEIFEKLVETGFERVKSNTTRVLLEKIIPEMEAHMLAGSNPRHVARQLSKIFGDANNSWERLARSEMSMAAERGKLDEFKAEEVKKVEFVSAPDACPICQALVGIYDIDKVPLPVEATHPRCYCTLASVIEN